MGAITSGIFVLSGSPYLRCQFLAEFHSLEVPNRGLFRNMQVSAKAVGRGAGRVQMWQAAGAFLSVLRPEWRPSLSCQLASMSLVSLLYKTPELPSLGSSNTFVAICKPGFYFFLLWIFLLMITFFSILFLIFSPRVCQHLLSTLCFRSGIARPWWNSNSAMALSTASLKVKWNFFFRP